MKNIIITLVLLSFIYICYCSESNDDNNDSTEQTTDTNELMDVHGAGAQRSDPKSGDPADYAEGHGPQGDVVYIYNYVRCVRGNSSTSNTYSIVDSGQDQCYDSGSEGQITCPAPGETYNGQDAQYAGLVPSYTDNMNDTITDNTTGLMWQKKIKKVSWSNAESDAASATTGGFSDWRVPTIKELYSLIDFSGATGMASPDSTVVPNDAEPYIDTAYFNFEYGSAPGRFIDAQYITSTSYVSKVMNDQDAFFGVNFADGRIKGYPKSGNPMSDEYFVRYVRENPAYGNNSFVDNGENTITDNSTGLTWMKIDSGHASLSSNISGYTNTDGSLNWQEALDFSENLTFAGHSDWRLPNAKELQSILDYTRSPDTTNSAAIDPIFSVTSIIDPGGDIDYPFYWTSTTHLDGIVLGEYAVYIAFGEAEGYMDINEVPLFPLE